MKSNRSIITASVLLGLLFSFFLSACAPVFDVESVRVLEFEGYEVLDYHAGFDEQHPDVLVDFALFSDENVALRNAQEDETIDIIHSCSSYFNLYVEKGLLQPLDTSRLQYWNDVFPELAEIGQINGEQYVIPWDWGFEAIAFRTDKLQTYPKSWADLWNSEYAGHVSIFDSGEDAYLLTALALGFEPYHTSADQDEIIKQKLIELKPNLASSWSDYNAVNDGLLTGDLWVVGNAWNDTYINLKRQNVPVEYSMPSEGALGWMCGYAISSKAENLDLVYDYLDAVMAPLANGKMAEDYAYGPGNRNSLNVMDQVIVSELRLNEPNILNQVTFMRPLTSEEYGRFNQMWADVKAAP